MYRNYLKLIFSPVLVFIFLATQPLFALNQLRNPTFAGNANKWTRDNGVGTGNILSYFNYDSYGGGSFRGDLTIPNRRRYGILYQDFTSPAYPVNCYVRISHLDKWSGAAASILLRGSLRDTTVGAYPNQGLVISFLNDTALDNPSWESTGWSSSATLKASTAYRVQIFWTCKTGTGSQAGAYIDNVYCVVSPGNLTANPSGSGVSLSWSALAGQNVTLDHYNVYRSTTSGSGYTLIGTSAAGTTTFYDSAPPVAEVVYYAVSDVDTLGNESPTSPEALYFPFFVKDGLHADIDETWLKDRIEANWVNPKTTLLKYRGCAGTTAGGSDLVGWQDLGLANHLVFTGLSLASGTTYYVTVQAVDQYGATQQQSISDGVTVREHRILTDTASGTYFNNARVVDLINLTTDPQSFRPDTFSSPGLWRYRRKITVTEPGIIDRINAPCYVDFTVPSGQMANVNEIRVADSKGNEVPRYNLPGSTTTAPKISILVNLRQGETADYWVYWGNNGVGDPAGNYGWLLSTNQTADKAWTPYYTRRYLPAGLETVPLNYAYSWLEDSAPPDYPENNLNESWAEEFEYKNGTAAGGYNSAWRDDARSNLINLFGGNFYFYGTNNRQWRVWSNGLLYGSIGGAETVDANDWRYCGWAAGEFDDNLRFLSGIICPFWADLKYDKPGFPDNPGVYRDALTSPTREVFTWRCNIWLPSGEEDDIYIFQTVLYRTGDIAHRYEFLSPRATTGGASSNPIVNIHNTAGISANDNSAPRRFLQNTPLAIGIGQTPTSFFQSMDAFRGFVTVGPIEGAGTGMVAVSEIQSMVFDSTTATPYWEELQYDCSAAASAEIGFFVRTGPTALPDLGGWSNWIHVATATANGHAAITAPNQRYIQHRCLFMRNSAAGAMPVVSEIRFICRGFSIDTVVADTPNGVSQGQSGIPVQVTYKSLHNADINITSTDLSIDLGSYTVTLDSPLPLPFTLPVGGTVVATFLVDVWPDSPTGTATVHAVATGTSGASTFSDIDADNPHTWWVRSKPNLVIDRVDSSFSFVNKGQNNVPVELTLTNTGETPIMLTGASFAYSLGFYDQVLLPPNNIGMIINGGETVIATVSVNVLASSSSGDEILNAVATGTSTFSGAVISATTAVILDTWKIQSPASLSLDEIIASTTVYRGQTGIPVYLNVTNTGEAKAFWDSSTLSFTLGTYDAVNPVSVMPIEIFGGLTSQGDYSVDISPLSATGTSGINAVVNGRDATTLAGIVASGALFPATWTIQAERVNTYKDASFLYPSTSFNRPFGGDTVSVFAKGTNLAPYKEYVVRWYDEGGTQLAYSNPPITADASGTLSHDFTITSAMAYGNYSVKITNPVNTITMCVSNFAIVSGADPIITVKLPDRVTIGQLFPVYVTVTNNGGAGIRSAAPGAMTKAGTGDANLVSGPTPALQDVVGYGVATFTYQYIAVTGGTFQLSTQLSGFDANSDEPVSTATTTSYVELPTTFSEINTGLNVTYYDNSNFTGLSVSRIDPEVNLYWREFSPDAAIGPDTFSSRWTGYLLPQYSENYTFYTEFDDGDRVWVNGTQVINNWVDDAAEFTSPTPLALDAGKLVPIVVEHYENGGYASAWLRWSSPSVAKAIIPENRLRPTTPGDAISNGFWGVYYDYYDGTNFGNHVITRMDPRISFNWSGGRPHPDIQEDYFYVQWFAKMVPPETATYTFYSYADDGNRLFINEQLVFSDWPPHYARWASGQIYLEAGKSYDLMFEFYELGGHAIAQLWWETPTITPRVIVPADVVTPRSPYCIIESAPNVQITTVQTEPTIVYRNQKEIVLTIELQNTGEAAAVISSITPTFTVGSYVVTLEDPQLPFKLNGRDALMPFTFFVDVDIDSPTGLSNIAAAVQSYDLNMPASTTSITGGAESWTVASVGFLIANNVSYSPEQYGFNRGQKVYVRAFGITPSSQWYRIRFYNTEIPGQGTAPAGWVNVSPMLAANASGTVDFFYDIPTAGAIGKWSVSIESDPDLNGNTTSAMLAVGYFKVQESAQMIATLTLSPDVVAINDVVTAELFVHNVATTSSAISIATPSSLIPTTLSVGSLTWLTGPVPASSSIDPGKFATFTWTYLAVSDSGIGSFSMTASLSASVFGVEENTGLATESNKAVSNSILILEEALDVTGLSAGTLDLGTVGPGDNSGAIPFQIDNIGNMALTTVRWNPSNLNGPSVIHKVNLTFAPDPVGVIATSGNVAVSCDLFVPYNQASGSYIATMSAYEDNNNNLNRDLDEPYDLFAVKVLVPEQAKVVVVEDIVDLGDWSEGATTASFSFSAFNGGNIPMTRLKFRALTAPYYIYVTPSDPGNLAVAGVVNAQVSAVIPATETPQIYIATWTLLNDSVVENGVWDAGEASDTFQVRLGVGGKALSCAPAIVDCGVGTPTYVISDVKVTVYNDGSLPLANLRSNVFSLSDGMGNIIASENIGLTPPGVIPVTEHATATIELYVPAGTMQGTFQGIQAIFEDNNGNGTWEPGEASGTFILSVDVPAFKAIQVLQDIVDIGDVSAGTGKTVSFPCRNSGNVTLTTLYWEETNLVKGVDILDKYYYYFPPSAPFSVTAGEFFNRQITVDVPATMPQGIYTGSSSWLFEDEALPAASRDPGEPSDWFNISCKIGATSLDVAEAALTVTGDPNSTTPEDSFLVTNTGSLTLSNPKATATALIGPQTLTASCSLFTPNPMSYILAGQSTAGGWSVAVPPNTTAGAYNGTMYLWNDTDLDNVRDQYEASDTVSLTLNVNSKKVLEVVQSTLDLGTVPPGGTASGTIEIINRGNLPIDLLRGVSGQIIYNASSIPAASITFAPSPIATTLAVGASALASITVSVGDFQPEGTYSGVQMVYDDYNAANGGYDALEESATFTLQLTVVKKTLTVTDPVSFGNCTPGTWYNTGFTVTNTSAVPLNRLKWLPVNIGNGVATITTSMFGFTPTAPFIINAGTPQAAVASMTIASATLPGFYSGIQTVWEDENNDGSIQANEASATFELNVTIPDYPWLDIVPATVVIGTYTPGETTPVVDISVENIGNVTLPSAGFAWTLSNLVSGAFQINSSLFTMTLPLDIPVGQFGTASVQVGPIAAGQEAGVYIGTQQLNNGTAHDSCDFWLEIINSGLPDFQIASGSLFQNIATSAFSAVSPDNRYFLSGWVCPGTGSANISFVTYDEFGQSVGTVTVGIDSAGNLSSSGAPYAISNSGILEKVPFSPAVGQDFFYYRIFVSFDYTHDPLTASNTRLILNNNKVAAEKAAVWFDGIKLERISVPNQKEPTSYHPVRTLFSPTLKDAIDGGGTYSEW